MFNLSKVCSISISCNIVVILLQTSVILANESENASATSTALDYIRSAVSTGNYNEVIRFITKKRSAERIKVIDEYKRQYGNELIDDLKSGNWKVDYHTKTLIIRIIRVMLTPAKFYKYVLLQTALTMRPNDVDLLAHIIGYFASEDNEDDDDDEEEENHNDDNENPIEMYNQIASPSNFSEDMAKVKDDNLTHALNSMMSSSDEYSAKEIAEMFEQYDEQTSNGYKLIKAFASAKSDVLEDVIDQYENNYNESIFSRAERLPDNSMKDIITDRLLFVHNESDTLAHWIHLCMQPDFKTSVAHVATLIITMSNSAQHGSLSEVAQSYHALYHETLQNALGAAFKDYVKQATQGLLEQ